MSLANGHRVTLRFRDGVEQVVRVGAGQTILEAGLAQQAPLLSQCRSGSCATCSALLRSGTAAMRAGQPSVLLRHEADAGQRLLCLTEAQGECSFDLAYDSRAGSRRTQTARAFVDAVAHIAPDAVRLTLELAEGDWLDFLPGQFVQLAVPGSGEQRRYSIASTRAQLPRIELLIRLLPGGAMSDYLRQRAAPDDVITLTGPYGGFFLREGVRAPHILVAGGTGLAPLLAMLDTLRTQPGRRAPLLLSFGCASEETLFYREELALRRHWMPQLDLRVSIERGVAAADLRIGNPVAAIGAADVQDPATVAYLCGPPGLIEAGHDHLVALGVAAQHIYAEQFVPS
ncbi:MAG: 2Fe-2S iron-sulfur cluster binding domain-containing protein [Gammaproteobacteria bacterium]|nr:2Fe-2S iron-sulfur cluster binding domain-containing protein [Gammaproteobacteria bacterium]